MNGNKKSFIVLKEMKKAEKLSQESSGNCVVTSSPDEWIDTEVTSTGIDKVLGTLTFGRHLLA